MEFHDTPGNGLPPWIGWVLFGGFALTLLVAFT